MRAILFLLVFQSLGFSQIKKEDFNDWDVILVSFNKGDKVQVIKNNNGKTGVKLAMASLLDSDYFNEEEKHTVIIIMIKVDEGRVAKSLDIVTSNTWIEWGVKGEVEKLEIKKMIEIFD